MLVLDDIDRRLLDLYQRDLPLVARPFAAMAEAVGVGEDIVLARLARLSEAGVISRIGAVFRPHRCGHSTLAAMAVPAERLEEVAAVVSAYPQVNHNYQRDHTLNLWFVIAAADAAEVAAVMTEIKDRTGIAVLDLPLIEDFHIDLGFDIRWS
ncbi:MAG: AsnC family transcriptional regulator [Magnetospirillum sp.]|nr:AsnC family transcriptional regulator [Magnetospirillum sp.]